MLTLLEVLVVRLILQRCFVDPNESINYTARTTVRLFVSLKRAEWRVTNLFLCVNKKPNWYFFLGIPSLPCPFSSPFLFSVSPPSVSYELGLNIFSFRLLKNHTLILHLQKPFSFPAFSSAFLFTTVCHTVNDSDPPLPLQRMFDPSIIFTRLSWMIYDISWNRLFRSTTVALPV